MVLRGLAGLGLALSTGFPGRVALVLSAALHHLAVASLSTAPIRRHDSDLGLRLLSLLRRHRAQHWGSFTSLLTISAQSPCSRHCTTAAQ